MWRLKVAIGFTVNCRASAIIYIFSEERLCAAVLKVNLIDSAAICSEASEKDDLMSSFKGNHNKIAMHHFFGTPCIFKLYDY